ncbi:hypothetical protein Q7P37_010174 [Cladosporium fusiforme]
MKTDNYLTLCLEQATKSPLHYRHGCIIVRGGKVIGQGFNDYRPGYDGGALKHGRVANSALNGPALAEMKMKLKQRKEKLDKQECEQQAEPEEPTAFGKMGGGGGAHANTPLSMHSEMMAIHSALSTSSTMACSTFAREKPCFKLPRGDKKKERLRKDVLKTYVERICETTSSTSSTKGGKLQVQECRFEGSTSQQDEDRAFQAVKSIGKHQNHNEKKKGKHNEYKYQYQQHHNDPSGRQTQRGSSERHRQQPSASKSRATELNTIRGYDCRMTDDTTSNVATNWSSPERGEFKKGRKRSKNPKDSEQGEMEHILLPQGETGKSRNEVNDRKKNPRLVGADLYVTRLGWNKTNLLHQNTPKKPREIPKPEPEPTLQNLDSEPPSLSSSTTSISTLSTPSSLHDELRTPSPPSRPPAPESPEPGIPRKAIHASRPCYRCISYMHAVGIKRVFWTNDAGEWEGGKVAKFVDALDGDGDEGGCGGGPMGNGVFVTKHEVLMMKRLMGG